MGGFVWVNSVGPGKVVPLHYLRKQRIWELPPGIHTLPESAAPAVYFKTLRHHINIWLLSSLIYQPSPTGSLCTRCPHSEDKCIFPRCQGKVAECQLVSVSPWLRLGHSGTTGVFLFPLLPLLSIWHTLLFLSQQHKWNQGMPPVNGGIGSCH